MDKSTKEKDEPDLNVMKEAVRRHYQGLGFGVRFPDQNIRVGNAEIDGEIIVSSNSKIAVELKGPGDDEVVKGIGQLVEAEIDGYQQAILVVTERRGRTVRRKAFRKLGIGLVAVDLDGTLRFIEEAKDSAIL